MNKRLKSFAIKLFLLMISMTIASSLIVSGSCYGPIDQIFSSRDKTGCVVVTDFIGQTIGERSEQGAIALLFLFVVLVFYYVLYRFWGSSFNDK